MRQNVISCLLTLAALAALAGSVHAKAQTAHATAPSAPGNAAWTRAFAAPSVNHPALPPAEDELGNENGLNNDPRFEALLKASFHQRQSFWGDHGKLSSVPGLVQTFIGVPGSALLDENRYVTANGCVPHDCGDRGMLWIDTASHPAFLIFAATGLLRGDTKGKDVVHLWLFSSKQINSDELPPSFLRSLNRWNLGNYPDGYKLEALLMTIVQPSGYQIDLTYPTLPDQRNETGAKQ